MAAQVDGTMTLGDLVAWVTGSGYAVVSEEPVQWSGEYRESYTPRYFVNGNRWAPLPTSDDLDLFLDRETVAFYATRLGLGTPPPALRAL